MCEHCLTTLLIILMLVFVCSVTSVCDSCNAALILECIKEQPFSKTVESVSIRSVSKFASAAESTSQSQQHYVSGFSKPHGFLNICATLWSFNIIICA